MVLKSKENVISAWAFLIGVVLAAMVGVFSTLIKIPYLIKYSAQIYGLLALIGIVVGSFIKVEGKENHTFLIAGTVLVIISKFGRESVSGSLIGLGLGDVVSSIFGALLILFIPATIIVALKTVFSIAKV
ncbi:MAG TPA: hypothetical protein VJA20_00780 [Candidatus Nanoarchaeia archaeon]|nr:hypothetical protein [Candidatus Nanoarchaeia archaeon]